ncbi:MAG: dTDP-4-dehydrorhamnose 3,5-epimerase [Isosphaeraceae bacterium]
MNVIPTGLPGVVVIEPRVFADLRGHFLESWSARRYAEAGLPAQFVQDNLSVSRKGVLRGLHLQAPSAQSKLIGVLEGEIYDVAVDVRVGSPTFGKWVGVTLSANPPRQIFVPAGFAHGFVVLSESASVHYKCDAYYAPADELTVLWNDPDLAIDWPTTAPILSPKDGEGRRLRDIPRERLPQYDA